MREKNRSHEPLSLEDEKPKEPHSTAQDPDKRTARRTDIEAAHAAYLELAGGLLLRARETRIRPHLIAALPNVRLEPLDAFIAHGERQIDRIRRRVLCGDHPACGEGLLDLPDPHR